VTVLTGGPNEIGVAAPVRSPVLTSWETRIAQSFGACPQVTVPPLVLNVLRTAKGVLRSPFASACVNVNGWVVTSQSCRAFWSVSPSERIAPLHSATLQSLMIGVSTNPVPDTVTV